MSWRSSYTRGLVLNLLFLLISMSAVMGRPYQIQEAKPLLIPMHPMSLPFDMGRLSFHYVLRQSAHHSFPPTGVIAHLELQTIIGQVMDTFRDRIYGLSTASDEMPNPAVMKVCRWLYAALS